MEGAKYLYKLSSFLAMNGSIRTPLVNEGFILVKLQWLYK